MIKSKATLTIAGMESNLDVFARRQKHRLELTHNSTVVHGTQLRPGQAVNVVGNKPDRAVQQGDVNAACVVATGDTVIGAAV